MALTEPIPYITQEPVIRSNLVRQAEVFPGPTRYSVGIWITYCGKAIMENNVVDLDEQNQVRYGTCGAVKVLNNQTPSRQLIQGYNTVAAQNANDLATSADLALTLAIR